MLDSTGELGAPLLPSGGGIESKPSLKKFNELDKKIDGMVRAISETERALGFGLSESSQKDAKAAIQDLQGRVKKLRTERQKIGSALLKGEGEKDLKVRNYELIRTVHRVFNKAISREGVASNQKGRQQDVDLVRGKLLKTAATQGRNEVSMRYLASNFKSIPRGTTFQMLIGGMFCKIETLGKDAEGGYGRVFLATDLRTGKKHALKFATIAQRGVEEAKQRLNREAQIQMRLEGSSNIASSSWAEVVNTKPPVMLSMMDYVEGGDLLGLINEERVDGQPHLFNASNPKFDPEGDSRPWVPSMVCLDVAVGIAQGLRDAHQEGVLHRDLKPENVLITLDKSAAVPAKSGVGPKVKEVKLGDFGFARSINDGEVRLTEGTPCYMAPEVIKKRPQTKKTDIFSLGALFYELIFKAQLPANTSKVNGLDEGEKEKLEFLGYSEEMISMLDRMLKKDPKKRPPIEEVLQALYTERTAVRELFTAEE